MRKPKLQNRVGRGIATLPVSALLALALWWWPQGSYSHDYVLGLVLVALTAYVLVETNNTFQLIRVRSRMVASVWLLGMAGLGFLHPLQSSLAVAFCLAVSYHLLFRSYQRAEDVYDVFHAFLMLSLGSILFPPLLFYVPFYCWYLLVFMRALSLRTFFAAWVGLFLPFWFWGGYLLWQCDFSSPRWWEDGFLPFHNWVSHLSSYITVTPECWWQQPLSVIHLSFLFWVILAVSSSIYYLQRSYDDKIRVRMMLYVYIFQTALTLLFAFLHPQDAAVLLPLLLLNAAPLVAHYFTLRSTWLCFFSFLFFLLGAIYIGYLTFT